MKERSLALVPTVEGSSLRELADLPIQEAMAAFVKEKIRGRPRGYVPIPTIIAVLRCLPCRIVQQVALGEKPDIWYEDELTFQWQVRAKAELAGKYLGEDDARLEGKTPDADDAAPAVVSVNVGPAR